MLKANISAMRETSKDMPRKDQLTQEIAVIDPATGRAIVKCRIYIPNSVAYCCLWISAPDCYGRGAGKVGGYGYHKPSAALQDAIDDAGITLHGDVYGRESHSRRAYIDGVGDSAMVAALEAIARSVTGKRRFIVHVAHP